MMHKHEGGVSVSFLKYDIITRMSKERKKE
jgi:hypothetical protein